MQTKLKSSGLPSCLTALALLFSLQIASAQRGDVRAAIEAGNKEFLALFARGDSAGVASLYTTNAQAFPPNSDIVSGKEAIQKLWQGVINSGVKDGTLKTLEVEAHGDTAHEVGTYTMIGEGGKLLDSGKYVVIWKREQKKWKIHRDIWDSNQPAAAK
ncbi:MAG: DUF4440 domain-containing protein [Verrucomicrobia bacterium]|nr:DUF4440 domain-containing protein [Verrucomicrobiota bacterium]